MYNKCIVLKHWSGRKSKYAKIYEYYKLNFDFLVDLRYSYSPSIKKMIEAAKNFCINAIMQNSNLLTRKIVNLISESELEIIVGKSTITIILNNLSYKCKNLNLELRTMANKKLHV